MSVSTTSLNFWFLKINSFRLKSLLETCEYIQLLKYLHFFPYQSLTMFTSRSDSLNILKYIKWCNNSKTHGTNASSSKQTNIDSELRTFYPDHGFQNSIEIPPPSIFMRYASVSDIGISSNFSLLQVGHIWIELSSANHETHHKHDLQIKNLAWWYFRIICDAWSCLLVISNLPLWTVENLPTHDLSEDTNWCVFEYLTAWFRFLYLLSISFSASIVDWKTLRVRVRVRVGAQVWDMKHIPHDWYVILIFKWIVWRKLQN